MVEIESKKFLIILFFSLFLIFSNKSYAASSAYLDGSPTGSISTNCASPTYVANLTTSFPAGDNLLIAAVQANSTDAGNENIAPGDLKLLRSGSTLTSNEYSIKVGIAGTHNSYVLIAKDVGAPANPSYNVTVCSDNTVVNAEAKILALSGISNNAFVDGASTSFSSTETTITTLSTSLSAGNNIVIASVQIDNGANAQTIAANNIELTRDTTVLASNQFAIILGTGVPTDVQSILLIAKDVDAPANPTYKVNITGAAAAGVAEAKVLVIQTVDSAYLNGSSIAIGTFSTYFANLTTNFAANSEVVIIGTAQFKDTDAGVETIAANIGYNLTENNAVSSNQFQMRGFAASGSAGDSFTHTLLWRSASSPENPKYNLTATANGAGLNGKGMIAALLLSEIVPPQFNSNSTSVSSGTQYAPEINYGFQINFTDNIGISTAFFETNLNSSIKNYTVSCFGPATNVLCIINFTDLTAGNNYQYRWIANDTSNNFNSTDVVSYQIAKNTSAVIRLFLNETEGNKIYGQNQIANFTAFLNVSGKTIFLDSNYTGWALQSNANSRIDNITTLSSVGNNFNLTAYWNGDENYTASSQTYFFNITLAYLEVLLIEPIPMSTTDVIQNYTFTINATVFCRGGNCGNVNGTAMYNLSSNNPDTPINTTQGDKPFFINESQPSAMKACPTNSLDPGEFCNLTWNVNASGNINSNWKIGVYFNSSYSQIKNFTENATVSIVSCTVDFNLTWSSINFGLLDPSTGPYNASGNSNDEYNITVKKGSCNTDLYIKGTDLVNNTLNSVIGVGNATWNNVSNNYLTSFNLSKTDQVIKLNTPQNTNITTWYWLNVPAVYAGYYNGTITITGVKHV